MARKTTKKNDVVAQAAQVISAQDISLEDVKYLSHSPVESTMLANSDDGSIRVLKETWNYTDRQGNDKSSTKICVRPTFRRKDGQLYFAEPIASIKQDQWKMFKDLMDKISIS